MIGKLVKISAYTIGTLCIALILTVFGLPVTGWKALSVQTGSMRSAIDPGALVLVHRVPDSQLHIGDVITYNSMIYKGERITHRIIGFKQVGPVRDIVVKGDANKVADPPLMPSQVVGKVTTHVPYAGRAIDFVHSIPGLIALVYVPALLLIVYEVKSLVGRLTEIELEERKHVARVLRYDFVNPRAVPKQASFKHASVHVTPRPRQAAIPTVPPLSRQTRSIDGMRI